MKLLITGGCSFSECITPFLSTWPRHLSSILSDYDHISTGLGSQGNGLISRRLIYQISESLKTYKANDLLIGVMWSGPSRGDFYTQIKGIKQPNISVMENPTSFVTGSEKNWRIVNANWRNDPVVNQYYRTFHDLIGQYIYTYEHILRVQWFLKLHKIKYFMSTYTGEVTNEKNHCDVKHLYDQIDFSHFLPVVGEYEWCRDYSNIEFPVPTDNHPGNQQHKLFTEKIIIPFLKEKGYL